MRQDARVAGIGFNVYGHFSSPLGLTVAAMNTVALLRARGLAVTPVDVGGNADTVAVAGSGSGDRPSVNIFHVNPSTLLEMMDKTRLVDFDFRRRLNVCVPFWELPHVPDSWLPILRGMDVVLAPTEFIAEAIQNSDAQVVVRHFPQTVAVPERVVANRKRFGLPAGVTVFGMSFAAQAVIERKNPWAAIEAFRIAFPNVADVRLIVRAYDAGNADPTAVLERLTAATIDDQRISILSERLDYEDVLALYASYDVFVSLHRSEGLGLGPMESMMVGTPVVATNWSGVLDFMTDQNSCLVRYELVPVDVSPSSPYGSEAMRTDERWAQPDVHDAARLMRRLYDEPGWRQDLGVRARSDMIARHAAIEKAPFVDDLVERVNRLDDPLSGHAARAEVLDRMQRLGARQARTARIKRAILELLRAMGLKPRVIQAGESGRVVGSQGR